LSTNTEKQLVSLLQSSLVFIPQLAELTIVSWLAVLPVFLRCFFDNKTEEDWISKHCSVQTTFTSLSHTLLALRTVCLTQHCTSTVYNRSQV